MDSRIPPTKSAATTWSTTTRSWSASTHSAETPRCSRRRCTSTTSTFTARRITRILSVTSNSSASCKAQWSRANSPGCRCGRSTWRPAAASTGGCSPRICPTRTTGSRLRDDGGIEIAWVPNNVRAHKVLVRETSKLVRKMGYPVVFTERTGHRSQFAPGGHRAGRRRPVQRRCSTPTCRTHDVDNLFVVDSAFFPSLPVMNPALTIAANAFRVAPTIAACSLQRRALAAG